VNREQLLKEIKSRLKAAHRDRLRGVILYGSEARGEAHPESDIDLLVLLEGPVDLGRDLESNLDVLYPLALQIGRRISAKPVLAEEYNNLGCPLYKTVHTEGLEI